MTMDIFTSDESLKQWLVRNYKRYFKSNISDPKAIIDDLHGKGFNDSRIVDFAKAENHMSGVSVHLAQTVIIVKHTIYYLFNKVLQYM